MRPIKNYSKENDSKPEELLQNYICHCKLLLFTMHPERLNKSDDKQARYEDLNKVYQKEDSELVPDSNDLCEDFVTNKFKMH